MSDDDREKCLDGEGVTFASVGWGPLVQSDYRVVIEGADLPPEDLEERVKTRSPEFSPPRTAAFRRSDGCEGEAGLASAPMGRCDRFGSRQAG